MNISLAAANIFDCLARLSFQFHNLLLADPIHQAIVHLHHQSKLLHLKIHQYRVMVIGRIHNLLKLVYFHQ
jgi:hypothetical protein